MNSIRKWIFSKKNNKKYKKQQFLKALKLSHTHRKKKLTFKSCRFFSKSNIKYNKNIGIKALTPNIYYNINLNWLLNK